MRFWPCRLKRGCDILTISEQILEIETHGGKIDFWGLKGKPSIREDIMRLSVVEGWA